jgi:hypothetical protein
MERTYTSNIRQDAGDFLRDLLCAVNREAVAAHVDGSAEWRDAQAYTSAAEATKYAPSDPLLDLFAFLTKTTVACHECGEGSVRYETTLSLTAYTPPGTTAPLHALLDTTELLDGDNQYMCFNCGCKHDATKCVGRVVDEAMPPPEIVVILLQGDRVPFPDTMAASDGKRVLSGLLRFGKAHYTASTLRARPRAADTASGTAVYYHDGPRSTLFSRNGSAHTLANDPTATMVTYALTPASTRGRASQLETLLDDARATAKMARKRTEAVCFQTPPRRAGRNPHVPDAAGVAGPNGPIDETTCPPNKKRSIRAGDHVNTDADDAGFSGRATGIFDGNVSTSFKCAGVAPPAEANGKPVVSPALVPFFAYILLYHTRCSQLLATPAHGVGE